MAKTYVIDTNVLLHDPKSLFAFEENELVIPLIVLDELDKKKNGTDEIARNAREVIRSLDALRSLGNISVGIATNDNGLIRVELSQYDIPQDLDPTRADNRIIGSALGLLNSGKNIVVVTKDVNLRVKCDALNIKSEDYNNDQVANDVEEIYSGIKEIIVTQEYINSFNETGTATKPDETIFDNQYVYLKALDAQKCSTLARFDGEKLVKLNYYTDIWGISPKNKEQTCAFDALFDAEVKLVTLIGRAGSGKTLCAVGAGLSHVFDKHTYKRMVIAKAPYALSKNMQLGFLPGSLEEKLDPWLSSIWDNMTFLFGDKGKVMIERYCEEGQIEICSLEHIRGRSISDSFILIDEAQNLSKHEIKSIITRAGNNTKIVLTGDVFQIDNLYLDSLNNGLSNLVEAFKTYKIAAHVTFKKGERSELASIASEVL